MRYICRNLSEVKVFPPQVFHLLLPGILRVLWSETNFSIKFSGWSFPGDTGKVNENLRLICGTDSCLKVLTGYLLSPLGQSKNDKLAS